jgi:hypothetical protein
MGCGCSKGAVAPGENGGDVGGQGPLAKALSLGRAPAGPPAVEAAVTVVGVVRPLLDHEKKKGGKVRQPCLI